MPEVRYLQITAVLVSVQFLGAPIPCQGLRSTTTWQTTYWYTLKALYYTYKIIFYEFNFQALQFNF